MTHAMMQWLSSIEEEGCYAEEDDGHFKPVCSRGCFVSAVQ
jgi:hypothetical protein